MLVGLHKPIAPAPVAEVIPPLMPAGEPVPTAVPYPWEGSDNGMAADGIHRSPLTMQQEVGNIGPVETAPKTQVNPTHEQGWGRAPGWQWGWMRKNIPTNPAFSRNAVKRLGQTRVEGPINSGKHAPGTGKYQDGHVTRTPQRGVLAQPQTTLLTAAVNPIEAWGEPV